MHGSQWDKHQIMCIPRCPAICRWRESRVECGCMLIADCQSHKMLVGSDFNSDAIELEYLTERQSHFSSRFYSFPKFMKTSLLQENPGVWRASALVHVHFLRKAEKVWQSVCKPSVACLSCFLGVNILKEILEILCEQFQESSNCRQFETRKSFT